jgi:hypothetical protein
LPDHPPEPSHLGTRSLDGLPNPVYLRRWLAVKGRNTPLVPSSCRQSPQSPSQEQQEEFNDRAANNPQRRPTFTRVFRLVGENVVL